MKVSEMIRNLQKFMKENGDLDCWYAVDDEGNSFNEIYFEPTLYYVNEDSEVYQSLDDLECYELDLTKIQQICVVN